MRHWPAALLAFATTGAGAASLDVTVRGTGSAPLEDAVVYAVAKVAPRAGAPRPAEVAQQDRQFAPPVSVVQVGASVHFPNRDPFRHHVYSFSTPRKFEIKLYVGTPAEPVVFDKPGEVVLGCNIHDSMVGYIYVVDTPYFAKSGKDGRARIEGLPAGEYSLHVWHYAQAAPQAPRAMALKGEETGTASFSVGLKALPPPRPASN